MKSFIIGVVLASVAAFIWGAFYWVGPLTKNAFKTQRDDITLRSELLENLPASGTYFVPDPNMEMEQYKKLHEQGGIAMIHYVKEGRSPDMGGVMTRGFLLNLVISLVLAVLLRWAAPVLQSYVKRVGFIALIGLVAATFANINASIWWYISGSWTFTMFFYDFAIYVVSGLVLAAFVKSPKKTLA